MSTPRHIYTVSELTTRIKSSLEKQFDFVWVAGEITNFRSPVSGHFYFTLKDPQAQINAVMFRGQNQNLKFDLENGMAITALGRISVYEPRGVYQIILEYIEPKGIGELQIAFEQLKQRLAQEGYFDDVHKKAIPFLPRKIALITSKTGAVIHDMCQVLGRRFPNIPIQIVPVKVQGEGAIQEIVQALETVNNRQEADVVILARGGGSLEDLQAFNSEPVARAIYQSEIPIISAVGHETDFTIADFVADKRAATPSVAAELVAPLKSDLARRCADLHRALISRVSTYLVLQRQSIREFSKRIIDPRHRIHDMNLRIDDLTERMTRSIGKYLKNRRDHVVWRTDKLYSNSPLNRIDKIKVKLDLYYNNLLNKFKIYFDSRNALIHTLAGRLQSLSPEAILARGYSITRTIPDGTIVHRADEVDLGQILEVTLHKGTLSVAVQTKKRP